MSNVRSSRSKQVIKSNRVLCKQQLFCFRKPITCVLGRYRVLCAELWIPLVSPTVTFRFTGSQIGFSFFSSPFWISQRHISSPKFSPFLTVSHPQSTLTWGVNKAASVHQCNLVCSEGSFCAGQHAATGIRTHSGDTVIPASIPYMWQLIGADGKSAKSQC